MNAVSQAPAEKARPPRLGLRREILILLPTALLLLVVLSTFTLFSYRSALSLLASERRDEAVRLARVVADRLGPAARVPGAAELRQLAPMARTVALIDAAGTPLAFAGELTPLSLPAEGGDRMAAGLDDDLPDAAAGFALLQAGGQRRYVRVDLPAGVLAGQLRTLRVLSFSVLGINGGLTLLVLFFLGHLLSPYDRLLASARRFNSERDDGDEVELILAAFDRAQAALAGAAEHSAEDDIAALERTLAPSLQSGLLLLGRDGDVLSLNELGAKLLGTVPPEPGTPLAEVLAEQPELLRILASAVAQESAPQRLECTVRSGSAALTVGLTVHPLRRDDGGVRGYLVLFADLTEVQRRAGEARLAESLSRLGEMAGGVAHELRNSLATLSGYLTLIERRPAEESIADYLAEIRHEAAHLERVLEDFLSFARPGTARMSELSLSRLVRRAAADPALAGAEVRLHIPDEEIWLRGDPQLLERAVRNLLHNAVQAEREAAPAGAAVELSLARRDEGAELVIADHGAGVPPEVRERLFHPFATGRRGGVGLGLALAHRIVVLHGGRIRLEDRSGGGTRAVLSFPLDTIATGGNDPGVRAASGSGPDESS